MKITVTKSFEKQVVMNINLPAYRISYGTYTECYIKINKDLSANRIIMATHHPVNYCMEYVEKCQFKDLERGFPISKEEFDGLVKQMSDHLVDNHPTDTSIGTKIFARLIQNNARHN